MDTTWRGKALRRWHDRFARLGLLFCSILRCELRKRWDEIRYPNPAKYI